MPELSAAAAGLRARAETFEPRGTPLAVARSLLALASLSVVLTTPDRGLFAASAAQPTGMRCAGVRAAGLWCLAAQAHSLYTARLVTVVVLVAVAIGLSPRWTCVPHWYVTFSLGTATTVANGGESAGRIATALLIPLCLGDGRRWQWSAPGPLTPTWRGAGYAAHLVLRLQVAVIYLCAAGGKLAVPAWRDGSYLAQVFTDPYYGLPQPVRAVLGPVLLAAPVVAVLTWGTIVGELAIAASMAAAPGTRRRALAVAILLHGGITVMVGLVSFGLVMIALVTLTLESRTGRATGRRGPALSTAAAATRPPE